MEKKPWYKSKIILMAISAILIFGSNLLNGWLTTQGVTPEQIDALAQAQPPVLDAIDSVKQGANIVSTIGSLFGVFILLFRAWFTNTIIG